MAGEHAAQLAREEECAVATAATALPTVHTLAAAYRGAPLAIVAGGAPIRRVWLVRRPV